jgi:hypothetical protein
VCPDDEDNAGAGQPPEHDERDQAVGTPIAHGRRRLAVAGVAVALVAGAVAAVVLTGATSPGRPTGHRMPAISQGPDGVVASWVLDQNRLPGTTSWKIPRGDSPGAIEGFADHVDATVGERVGFYVSTRAKSFHVDAYRMGWYQGTGAHLVWTSGTVAGRSQARCPRTAGINMVSCTNWRRSFELTLTSAFVQGDYLFKLVAGPKVQSYVLLTVWDPSSHATYLVMARSFTEEGWNTFGGFDFYQGFGPCAAGAPAYPVCNRARVVSFDRPFTGDDGAADFFGEEYPLVRYCERHGLDVAYVTDVTVSVHPSIVANHKVVLSPGHDESWSYTERLGLEHAVAKGTNVVFFGAASVLRHVRLQGSVLGPDREVVDYRDASEDPLNGHGSALQVTGNTWSSAPSYWPETSLVGEVYSGYLDGAATSSFVVADASSWLFKGTGLRNGSTLPGVIASDIDHVVDGPPTPSDLMVLGHSPIAQSIVYSNQGWWNGFTYSDMTYFTYPHRGAGVIDTGNNNWINAMGTCTPRVCAALDRITGNILWLFGHGPAGDYRPSHSNLGTINPRGS